MDLQRLADWVPTGFDAPRRYYGDDDTNGGDWLVVLGHTRDSDRLDESNYTAAVAILDELDPDFEDHEERSYGHWGFGWIEILIVKPGSPCHDRAVELIARLADYPALDDEDLSEREWSDALDTWSSMDLRERIELCARHDVSIFAARRDEIPHGLPYLDELIGEC